MRPILAFLLMTLPAAAFEFDAIEGGTIDLADLRGQAVLVVNTASQCGYTGQYEGLQALQDTYGPRGLTVLAVPSDDFNQELASNEAVAEFCEVTFGLTLPMTTITPVRGEGAHPFYQWLADQGHAPRWNFNKALLTPEGELALFAGSNLRPEDPRLIRAIESALPK